MGSRNRSILAVEGGLSRFYGSLCLIELLLGDRPFLVELGEAIAIGSMSLLRPNHAIEVSATMSQDLWNVVFIPLST
ncbi:MAG: hypothetical protein ACFE0J_19560 [Elainellaceae cyanobacterium]